MNTQDSDHFPGRERPDSPRIRPGLTLGIYRIVNKLGAGGMGEVWLADDTTLDREVALKFLPDWVRGDSQAKTSLINEAKAASKINHPGLVSIHAIEHIDDLDFIVMEYVKGEHLSDLIKGKTLSHEQKIDIILQLALGLKSAHEQGTIHRDIKPDNIIITGTGQAKLLDFGLALIKNVQSLSEKGKTGGTMAYSSPEQVQNQTIDHRSDIFSLGVLMYEMFTGKLPFSGEYEAAYIYSIVNEMPPPISGQVPEYITQVIFKALEKNPDNRYQDIDQLITDLKSIAPAPPSRPDLSSKPNIRKQAFKTVVTMLSLLIFSLVIYFVFTIFDHRPGGHQLMLAVMPLENLGNPEDEYFADGMTDAIITELAQAAEIGVISLSSTIQYKNTSKDIREIGTELGADYALIGTIHWLKEEKPPRIKINPKLIKISENTYVWAKTYELEFEQLQSLQNEIARDVTSTLNLKLSEQYDSIEAASSTKNMEAYGFYLKGNMYFCRGWEEKDLHIAEEMYGKAIKLDPGFAIAYTMLARVHACLYWDYYDRSESRITLSRQMIDKALKLAPNLPEAKLALGIYYYSKMEYEPAMDLFLEVLRYQPNNIEATAAVAGVYRRSGKLEEAVSNYIEAYRRDPRSNIKAFDVGLTYGMMRDYPKAIAYLDKSIDLAPDWPMAYILKAWLYLFWKGDVDISRKVIREASSRTNLEQSEYYWWLLRITENDPEEAIRKAQLKSDTTSYYLHLARLYSLSGQIEKKQAYYDSARVILERKVQAQPENARYHSQLGLACAGLGQKDRAIEHGVTAMTILPPSREAIYSLFFLLNLAEIYVLVGEDEKAIQQIEYSMSIPGFVSPPYLKLDPVWQPLRNNPRFEKLIEKAD